MTDGRWRLGWGVILIVGLGCATQHPVDDAPGADAGPSPPTCEATSLRPGTFACGSDTCGVVRDDVVLRPARAGRLSLALDALGRPVTAVAVDAPAHRTYLAIRDEAGGSELDPALHDADWSFHALGDEGYGARVATGVADGAPCTIALEAVTDPATGPGTLRLLELRDGAVRELARADGSSGEPLLGAAPLALLEPARLGVWSDAWQVGALDASEAAGIAVEGDGALVAWIARRAGRWLRATHVGTALPRVIPWTEDLREIEPPIRHDGRTRLPETRIEVAVREGAPVDAAILVSDPSGSLHLHRRDASGWRHDVLGVGSGLDCGSPEPPADACAGTDATHVGLDVSIDERGAVLVLVRREILELELIWPNPFEDPGTWEDLPGATDAVPEWSISAQTELAHGGALLVALPGEAPRAVDVAGTLASADDGAMALGPDGALHLLVRSTDAAGVGALRYLVLAPR